jgi:excisionase family DNA binding protein
VAADETALCAGISLREAADRLGVHYMTAYRYVRTGRLPAVREGAEWRVAPADLAAVHVGAARPGSRRGSRTAARTRLRSRLLAADEAGAWAVVESTLAAGATPAEVHLRVLGPALVDIGTQWAAGDLTVAEEHRASAVATRVIARLGPHFARRGRKRGSVLVGAVAGERHALPGAMLVDLLRGAGFDAVDLGADTPADSFVEAAAVTPRLVALVLGAFLAGRHDALAHTVGRLRAAGVEAPVLVGGRGVTSLEDARALGADGWTGADGATALRAICAATDGVAGRVRARGGSR